MTLAVHHTLRKALRALNPVWVWFTGLPLGDGVSRTNATWMERSHGPRPVLHPSGRAIWWHHLPRLHRAGIRTGSTFAFLGVLAGLVAATFATLVILAVLTAAGLVLGAWHAWYRIRNWRHERHYVKPLEGTLVRKIPIPPDSIEVKRDGDVVKSVAIQWPAETEIGTAEKQEILQAVTTRLAIEAPDASWQLRGRNRSVVFKQSEPVRPYTEWNDDFAAAINAAASNELVFGVGKRDAIVTAKYSDSPHLCIPGGSGGGKALALDTRVPTPSGWTTMGDITPGDLVYDETGTPVRVLGATEVMHGRRCYEVQFSDGSVVVADAGHQWLTEDAAARKAFGRAKNPPATCPTRIMTTEVMAASLRARRTCKNDETNYSVRVAEPLQCPEADLPIAPYTFGAWLGDGTSKNSSFTCADEEILDRIRQDGYSVTPQGGSYHYQISNAPEREHRVSLGRALVKDIGVTRAAAHVGVGAHAMTGASPGWSGSRRVLSTADPETPALGRYQTLHEILRDLGVLRNKHIPEAYLRASEEQRRALLAGLLDTDGYCAADGGVAFYSTVERLARDVHHLVATLGYKPTLRSKPATLYGKGCGTVWTVTFTPGDTVFHLPRKVARQSVKVRPTAGRRYITDIRPVPSVPVRCIEVDGPSHLYLVGETCIPTHNSGLAAFLLLQELMRGSP